MRVYFRDKVWRSRECELWKIVVGKMGWVMKRLVWIYFGRSNGIN